MQVPLETVLVAIGMLLSLVTAVVSLHTRLAIAELETRLTKEQAQRCKECEGKFASRRELELIRAGREPRPVES